MPTEQERLAAKESTYQAFLRSGFSRRTAQEVCENMVVTHSLLETYYFRALYPTEDSSVPHDTPPSQS